MVKKMIYLRPSKADSMVEPDKCLVCSREERLQLWTLDNGKRAGAMFLCPEHAAPMEVLMDAAAGKPPARQKSLRDERALPAPPKIQRKRPMAPMEWTPPD